jgi:hypothetical protein
MSKIGLILQLISFLMFFWDSEIRTLKPMEIGGGFCTTSFDKQRQLEIALSCLPFARLRKFISKYFHSIILILFIVGTILQLIVVKR